jgi:DMSO/TMAO reductase YedYZ molybdopterin-dependent catalytic subunit
MTIRSRGAPRVDVSGAVVTPLSWRVEDLDSLPSVDIAAVVPGFSGRAIAASDLLSASGLPPTADYCSVGSDDGLYRASIPLADLERGWLIYRDGDGPLSRSRGGPFRLVVEVGRTLCWNVKGVAEMRVTMGPEPDSVPENPPH